MVHRGGKLFVSSVNVVAGAVWVDVNHEPGHQVGPRYSAMSAMRASNGLSRALAPIGSLLKYSRNGQVNWLVEPANNTGFVCLALKRSWPGKSLVTVKRSLLR